MAFVMRSTWAAVLWLVLTVSATQYANAQLASSSISGSVLYSDGSVVADAPVRARSAATGTDARTRSSEDGRYDLPGLPAGTYTVSVVMPCCAFTPYSQDDVSLTADEVLQLDIRLVEGSSLNTLGDDPATMIGEVRRRQVITEVAVPRMADGRPDLTGVWLRNDDPYPEQPQALQWAADLAAERVANYQIDSPQFYCLPGSPPAPGGASFVVKFVQTPVLLLILLEGAPGFRQIFLDGREHPANFDPSWMGHSIGRWVEDTLVVDTVGFNSRGWMGIYPRTEMLRMEERYTRNDFGHLQVQVTAEDPGVFEEPWTQNMTWDLAPQEELFEYVCENNKWGQPE